MRIGTLARYGFGAATALVLGTTCLGIPCQADDSAPAGTPVNPLGCRLANYGRFQDAGWDHLPKIGFKFVLINVPPPKQVAAVRQQLADHGLRVTVIRGQANLADPQCVAQLAEQLATCEKLGAHYMFLSAKHPGVSKQTVYARLRQVGDIAKRHGVMIALETHPDLGTNGDIQLETMRQVNHPNIRVNFDTGNITFYNRGTTAVAELRKIVDYVATVELKDHNGQYKTWAFPVLGRGVVDFPEVLRILREHHFHGPVTLEIEGIKGVEWNQCQTEKAIAESAAYVRSLGQFE